MRFIGRWLGNAVNITFALLLAIIAMQAPAFTSDYAEALLQVAQDSRRDIEQREASARRFYALTAKSDDDLVAALRPFEPSNAETLALSLDRARHLKDTYDKITRSQPLLRPITALSDAFDDDRGYKAAVWRTLLGTYGPHVDLSMAAAAYGVLGLLMGSLLAQLVIAAGRQLGRKRSLARRA